MNRFEGRVALVTGGGSGIGRAAAIKFASEGAKVVIGNRNAEAGEKTVGMIQDAGGSASFLKTDVTDAQQTRALVKFAVEQYGGLDAAFNNAGVEDTAMLTYKQSTDQFDLMMDVNVKGVWNAMQAEIEQLLVSGGGTIVNNASIAGVVGFPGHGAYVASKHAVIGLTKTAALEHAKDDIRINAVNPGAIETDMLERFTNENQDFRQQLIDMHPIGRIGKPEEIADAVLWLSSEQSSFVLGQSIIVDGGFTAQ